MDYAALFIEGRFHLSFGNLVRFEVCFETKRIELGPGAQLQDPATLLHLLYDHVIPRVIAATGMLVLHGSAVEIGGRIAIFIGETGAGKSTLSASLHAKGHRLLGDDAVVVTQKAGQYLGEAVYPSLRLYPEAIAEILGEGLATAPMAHYSEKRHVLGFAADVAQPGPLPIGHIFMLTNAASAPQLAAISPREACMAMIQQSFALDPNDIGAAAERMQQAVALASAIPASRLSYMRDFNQLPNVHRLIEQRMADPAPAPRPDA